MALDFYHTSHTNTCQTVQWCLRALSQQAAEIVLLQHTNQNDMVSNSTQKKTKRNTWKHGLKLNILMVFTVFSPLRHHNSFIPRASTILSGVSPIRKTSGPRLCADGPDKARKTLMFIRQSLYRFHRCQSGKVTVTAPIKENGQNGNKGTDWELKLGNNASPTNDYSG